MSSIHLDAGFGEEDYKKRKGKDNDIKVLLLPQGTSRGPSSHVCSARKLKPLLHLLLLQDSVNHEAYESSWGGVPGRGDEFVHPTALPPS